MNTKGKYSAILQKFIHTDAAGGLLVFADRAVCHMDDDPSVEIVRICCSGEAEKLCLARRELLVRKKLLGCGCTIQMLASEEMADARGKTVYILQERYDSMAEHDRGNFLSDYELVRTGSELLKALIKCRDRGVLFGPVRPESIYVRSHTGSSRHRCVKLGGFADAVLADETEEGAYNEAENVRAVGMALLFLANWGKLPAEGERAIDELFQKRAEGNMSPNDHTSLLVGCLKKACDKNASARYQTYGEFRTALNGVLRALRSPLNRSRASEMMVRSYKQRRQAREQQNSNAMLPMWPDHDMRQSVTLSVAPDTPAMPSVFNEAQPDVSLDDVQFSAVTPEELTKGEYAILSLYMYEETYRCIVDQALATAEKSRESTSGFLQVEKRTRVTVQLRSPDVEIEDDTEEQIWSGRYLRFDFSIMPPETLAKKQILLTASVYFDDVIATRLKFIVQVKSPREQKIEMLREDVLSAFISYASQDRSRVATIIQGMKKVRPDMDIFFDVEKLRSGEDWEERLYREIERRDILYLCWSHHARQSQWVDREWRHAMDCNGIDSIEPIPMEPPDACPPPSELQKKHFNDMALLYAQKQPEPPRTARLRRTKTGETVVIDRPVFTIGRDRWAAAYCVFDNMAVGRVHAHIITRDGAFYLVDANSRNGVYLNGERIESDMQVKLPDEAIIDLADERFEFCVDGNA